MKKYILILVASIFTFANNTSASNNATISSTSTNKEIELFYLGKKNKYDINNLPAPSQKIVTYSINLYGSGWNNDDINIVRNFLANNVHVEYVNNFSMNDISFSNQKNEVIDFSYFFDNYSNIQHVTLPNSRQKSPINFSHTFANCKILSTVENLVQIEHITNAKAMFYGCTTLKSVVFLKEDNASISPVDLSYMFYGCYNLTMADNITRFHAISDIKYMFYDNRNLPRIDFGTIKNTSDIAVDMTSAFENCYVLTEINNLNRFQNISSLKYTFANNSKIKVIDFNKDSNISDIDVDATSTFFNCYLLTEINNFERFHKLSNINSMCYNAQSITALNFHNATNVAAIDATNAFANCYKIAKIENFGRFSNISSLNNTFFNCQALKAINLEFNYANVTAANGFDNTFTANDDKILKYLNDSVKRIPDRWVEQGYSNFVMNFTIIDLPELMYFESNRPIDLPDMSNAVNPDYASYSNGKWELMKRGEQHFSDFNIYTFLDDTYLGAKLRYSIFSTYKMDYVHSSVAELAHMPEKSVDILYHNGQSYTAKLNDLKIQNQYDIAKIKIYGGKSWNDIDFTSLKSKIYGDGSNIYPYTNQKQHIQSFDMGEISLDRVNYALNWLFVDHSNLNNVILPARVNNDKIILDGLFFNCTKLTEVKNLDRFLNISSMRMMFYNCQSINAIKFAEQNNISYESLDFEKLFYNCFNLSDITSFERFKKSHNINHAFENCYVLNEIRLGFNPSSIDDEKALLGTFLNTNPDCLKFLPDRVVDIPNSWKGVYYNFVIPFAISNIPNFRVINNSALPLPQTSNIVSPIYAALVDSKWIIATSDSANIEYTPGSKLNADRYDKSSIKFVASSPSTLLNTISSNIAKIYLTQHMIVKAGEVQYINNESPSLHNLTVESSAVVNVSDDNYIDSLILIKDTESFASINMDEYATLLVDYISIQKTVDENYFYFFSLPYDVVISDLIVDNSHLGKYGSDWLIKEYSENLRAEHGSKSFVWNILSLNDSLIAKRGYIIGVSNDNVKLTSCWKYNVPTNVPINARENTMKVTSSYFAGNNIIHKGWNLVSIPCYDSPVYRIDFYDNSNNLVIEDIMVNVPILHGTRGYKQVNSSKLDNHALGEAFFVQVPTDGYLKYVKNVSPRSNDINSFSIAKSDSSISDIAFLIHDHNAPQNEYMILGDLQDMSSFSDEPRIHFFDHNGRLAQSAVNTDIISEVPLHIYSPAAGKYTIHLDLKHGVYLYDAYLDIDVYSNEYRFTTDAKAHINDRFFVRFNKIVADNNDPNDDDNNWYMSYNSGVLTVNNVSLGDRITIINQEGKLITQFSASDVSISIPNLSSGTYLININDATQKFIVH